MKPTASQSPDTPRQRVEAVLKGRGATSVPFTIYECIIPRCAAERELRNRGLCIVERRVEAYRTYHPNVRVRSETFWEDGHELVRTSYETPVGTVSTLCRPAGFTWWWHERMWKRPEDYRTLLFLINDECYEPAYGELAAAQSRAGDDIIFRPSIGLEPLQSLITGTYMKMEDFCIEWIESRDEIERLYRALVEKRRQIYRIVAESPTLHANYGGNVVPRIIGRETFRDYYLQHYNEAAEVMHRHDKLVGCHFDDNNKLIADLIAGTDLDYIEAFTPAPGTDMSLAEARAAWPDKVLWLNFPATALLRPDAEVERATFQLLDELSSPQGVIMGITEDVPESRWGDSCRAIMNGLDRHARERSERYPATPGH